MRPVSLVLLGAAFGAWATLRQVAATREQVRTQVEQVQLLQLATQETQRIELFTRAVDHLGGSMVDVRIGGIYALERVGRSNPRDHEAICELLCSYIRHHAPWPPESDRFIRLPSSEPGFGREMSSRCCGSAVRTCRPR